MEEFIPIIVGAVIGFIAGMIAGGRIAGGKIVRVEPPYAYTEGGTPGCAGVVKQLTIAAIGTIAGAALGALVALIV